jgi:uncharacterized protein (TIGR03067 family)
MFALLSAAFHLALFVVCPAPADDTSVIKPFQGRWEHVAVVVNGNVIPQERFGGAVVTVTGDECVLRAGENVVARARLKVAPGKGTQIIDVTVSEGPWEGRTLKGLYKMKGIELQIILTMMADGERPTDFTCPYDSARLLQKFKLIPEKGSDWCQSLAQNCGPVARSTKPLVKEASCCSPSSQSLNWLSCPFGLCLAPSPVPTSPRARS